MSGALTGVESEGNSNVSLVSSSQSVECISNSGCSLKERNYLGLSDCSSVGSSGAPSYAEGSKTNLNLKATELKLGLPGSQSPERDTDPSLVNPRKFDEKPLFPLMPSQKNLVSGSKRVFSDTIVAFPNVPTYSEKPWMFSSGINEVDAPPSVGQGKFPSSSNISALLSGVPPIPAKDVSHTVPQDKAQVPSSNNACSPASKAQVVGWPPIRSFRKNSLATTSKSNTDVNGKSGPTALFVKVSMDGAPYLRKVDLSTYSTYQELSCALEKMFTCFTIGQFGSHGVPGNEKLTEIKLRDLLHGSDYVLTYEDRDGDWMLVGDVPWEMFIDTCKKLKIMKSADAIGLAPRAIDEPNTTA